MLTVAALYHFAPLPDPAARRAPLLALCEAEGVRGTIILAPEGVNGTIAGPRAGVDAVLAHLRGWPGCAGLAWKESAAAAMPLACTPGSRKPAATMVTMAKIHAYQRWPIAFSMKYAGPPR